MSRRKRLIARIFFALAVEIILVPVGIALIMEFGFQVRFSDTLESWGINPDWFVPTLFFISSGLYLVAAALQYPFREEEGWTCECGYDLSFLQKKSRSCPECGNKILWEWTPQSGQYSSVTASRIGWTMVLLLLSGTMMCVGLILQWASSNSHA